MHADILDLREFYDSGLGQLARRMLRRQLRLLWPNVRGEVVAGLGYATPYLGPFCDEAERVIALMPASQGVSGWPRGGPGRTALTEDACLPLPDLSVDRLLLVHGLEGAEPLRPMMREIWRVLAGGGRLLVVAPNRLGLWARADWTPFGHGNPYSASQLRQILRDNMFVPEREGCALFIPPLRSRFLLSTAPAWEEAGRRWFKAFAGVTMIEASKQVLSGVARRGETMRRRRLIVPLPGGALSGGARPAGAARGSASSRSPKEG